MGPRRDGAATRWLPRGDGGHDATAATKRRTPPADGRPRVRAPEPGRVISLNASGRSGRWRMVPGRPETLYTRIRRVQQGCGRTRDVAQVGSASALGAEEIGRAHV